jgi:biopolymer transport protein ExbD
MNWLGRLDIGALAVLLIYAVFTFVRVSNAYRALQRPARSDRANTQFNLELETRLRSLKSIAFVSPYLGLVGACVGIMSAFTGIGMEKHVALAMMASRVAASLVTTGAGIIVAVAAIVLSHPIRTLLDSFREEVARQRLPLGKRFSQFPRFALIAASVLGLSLTMCLVFSSTHAATGLDVRLAPARCEFEVNERVVVLRVTEDGRVFINQEQEDWDNLARRLSEIYMLRAHRTVYLSADAAVPFQTVADAISVAMNATGTENSVHLTVRLVTPAALKSECPDKWPYHSLRPRSVNE